MPGSTLSALRRRVLANSFKAPAFHIDSGFTSFVALASNATTIALQWRRAGAVHSIIGGHRRHACPHSERIAPRPITIIDACGPARIFAIAVALDNEFSILGRLCLQFPAFSRALPTAAAISYCAKHGSASDGRGTSCGIRSYSPAVRRARAACTSTLRRPFPARPTAARRSRSGCIPSRGLLRGR